MVHIRFKLTIRRYNRLVYFYFQFGIFHHGSKSYLIQPPDNDYKTHSVSQVDEEEPTAADFLLPNDDFSFQSTQGMCFDIGHIL